MIISKSGPVLGLIEVQGGEELFARVCTPKKAHGPLEHSGKLREAGGQFSQKLPKLVCFSTHLPELRFEFRVALQVNELYLKYREGILHIKGERVCKNLKCGSVRPEGGPSPCPAVFSLRGLAPPGLLLLGPSPPLRVT